MPDRSIPKEIDLSLDLDDLEEPNALRARVARKLGRRPEEIPVPVVVRRAIDARGGKVQFRVRVALSETANVRLPSSELGPREVKGSPYVVVIGDGPERVHALDEQDFVRSSSNGVEPCSRVGMT